MDVAPVVTLTNGLRVANFSSPHTFNFEDGSILGACRPERALSLKLDPITEKWPSPCGRWHNVDLSWSMPDDVADEIIAIAEDPEIDIVLVALPVRLCIRKLRETRHWPAAVLQKVRCIRVKDRVSKEIFIDRFCV